MITESQSNSVRTHVNVDLVNLPLDPFLVGKKKKKLRLPS